MTTDETRAMLDDWWESLDHTDPRPLMINEWDVADVRMLVADRDDRVTELEAENERLRHSLEMIAAETHRGEYTGHCSRSSGYYKVDCNCHVGLAEKALAEGQGEDDG